jgi:hypothetical protein
LFSWQKPSDIEIAVTAKLILHSACKACGTRVLIQAQTVLTTNDTNKDIIPPLSLEYDCCGLDLKVKSNKLSEIHMDLSTKNTVNCLEDLRLASHKVEEVEQLIAEQEWKIKQSKFDYHLSLLSYVGMITTSIIMLIFCYCCCCKYCKKSPGFTKWWKDNNPCTTTIIKPKIVNSVHSYREHLTAPCARVSIKAKLSPEDAIEETELVSLMAGKQLAPSGKR